MEGREGGMKAGRQEERKKNHKKSRPQTIQKRKKFFVLLLFAVMHETSISSEISFLWKSKYYGNYRQLQLGTKFCKCV